MIENAVQEKLAAVMNNEGFCARLEQLLKDAGFSEEDAPKAVRMIQVLGIKKTAVQSALEGNAQGEPA